MLYVAIKFKFILNADALTNLLYYITLRLIFGNLFNLLACQLKIIRVVLQLQEYGILL